MTQSEQFSFYKTVNPQSKDWGFTYNNLKSGHFNISVGSYAPARSRETPVDNAA